MSEWSVEAAARAHPDRVALVAGAASWTFRQLAERVRRSAARLAEAGVDFEGARRSSGRPGRVMMVAPNTTDGVCALLALFERGVPVMLVHPRSTPKERDQLARRYPPSARLDGGPPAVAGPGSAVATPDAPAVPATVSAERDLAVFFTSGTTGRPKAVRLSRRAFAASADASARNLGWRDDDRWLLAIPIAHIGGLSILTRCLLARRTVVLLDGRSTPERLAEACARHRVTLLSLVPTQLTRWLPATAPTDLRAVLLGGAPVSGSVLARAYRSGWPILTTYGLTEACSQVTVQPYGGPPSTEGDSGRPLPGTEVVVREGRILIRGPTMLTGYLPPAGAPPGPPPFDPDGWFDTGDIGQLSPDGRLFVQARRHDLILSGGENVYPKEVEAALADLPGVDDAVVFGVPDPEWGQVVAAALVVAGDFDPAVVDARVTASLAGPKRPRRWAVLPRFPLAPSGKVDRRAVIAAATAQLRPSIPAG